MKQIEHTSQNQTRKTDANEHITDLVQRQIHELTE